MNAKPTGVNVPITGARLGCLVTMARAGDDGVSFSELCDLGFSSKSNITNSPVRGLLKNLMIEKKKCKAGKGQYLWKWMYTINAKGASVVKYAYEIGYEYFIPSFGRREPIPKPAYDYALSVIRNSKEVTTSV